MWLLWNHGIYQMRNCLFCKGMLSLFMVVVYLLILVHCFICALRVKWCAEVSMSVWVMWLCPINKHQLCDWWYKHFNLLEHHVLEITLPIQFPAAPSWSCHEDSFLILCLPVKFFSVECFICCGFCRSFITYCVLVFCWLYHLWLCISPLHFYFVFITVYLDKHFACHLTATCCLFIPHFWSIPQTWG